MDHPAHTFSEAIKYELLAPQERECEVCEGKMLVAKLAGDCPSYSSSRHRHKTIRTLLVHDVTCMYCLGAILPLREIMNGHGIHSYCGCGPVHLKCLQEARKGQIKTYPNHPFTYCRKCDGQFQFIEDPEEDWKVRTSAGASVVTMVVIGALVIAAVTYILLRFLSSIEGNGADDLYQIICGDTGEVVFSGWYTVMLARTMYYFLPLAFFLYVATLIFIRGRRSWEYRWALANTIVDFYPPLPAHVTYV